MSYYSQIVGRVRLSLRIKWLLISEKNQENKINWLIQAKFFVSVFFFIFVSVINFSRNRSKVVFWSPSLSFLEKGQKLFLCTISH